MEKWDEVLLGFGKVGMEGDNIGEERKEKLWRRGRKGERRDRG